LSCGNLPKMTRANDELKAVGDIVIGATEITA
jgi:hypothetical protein